MYAHVDCIFVALVRNEFKIKYIIVLLYVYVIKKKEEIV